MSLCWKKIIQWFDAYTNSEYKVAEHIMNIKK